MPGWMMTQSLGYDIHYHGIHQCLLRNEAECSDEPPIILLSRVPEGGRDHQGGEVIWIQT